MALTSNWITAFQTTNLPEGVEADAVSKWIIMTRASVFPMTFFASAIGGLLAIPGGNAEPLPWCLAAVGLLLAHACNNLMNDYFDLESGVDTPDYARALYAPHPVLSGWISKPQLLMAIALVNLAGVGVAAGLTWWRGWEAAAFALAGFSLSVFYVAPPLRLKHHGLGEPSVFVIWGPLMIAGTYFVTAGQLPGWVWAASLPYGLLVTTVLFGKHIDKIELDGAKQINTLPVLLGDPLARRENQGLMPGFLAGVIAPVLAGTLGVWTLLVLAAAPRLRKTLRFATRPKPEKPPENYSVWPLWYVSAAFVLTRQAGGFLALGLVLNAIWPLHL